MLSLEAVLVIYMNHLIRNLKKNYVALLSLLTPHPYFEHETLVITTPNDIHGFRIVC